MILVKIPRILLEKKKDFAVINTVIKKKMNKRKSCRSVSCSQVRCPHEWNCPEMIRSFFKLTPKLSRLAMPLTYFRNWLCTCTSTNDHRTALIVFYKTKWCHFPDRTFLATLVSTSLRSIPELLYNWAMAFYFNIKGMWM